MSEPISVFIVDDHDLFRSGVRAEISDRVAVAGEASEVDAAVDMILERKPDVVLLDVHMPDGGGKFVLEKVHAVEPSIAFLALSASDAAEDVVAIIRAGARGYVTKSIGAVDLVDAIERVHAGDAVFSPKLAGFVLDAFAAVPVANIDPELDQLTDREREVLRLIARGYTYRETGEELFISVKTVETHVSNVLRKLQLTNRHELARWASERKLI